MRTVLMLICFLLGLANAYASEADDLFGRYFAQARQWAEQYPQEQVHLHIDNTSYY